MSTDTSAVRAPRLTEKLLKEDFPVAISVLEDEIDYLRHAMQSPLSKTLIEPFTNKLNSLTRMQGWLSGKANAETAHRTGSST